MSELQYPLAELRIGLSISDSPDLVRLGLGQEHVDEALITLAIGLMAKGATLAYGGDLREKGFTRILFDAAKMYNKKRPDQENPPVQIANYLAWPLHHAWDNRKHVMLRREFEGAADLILLPPPPQWEGRSWPKEGEDNFEKNERKAWGLSLDAMRDRITDDCQATIFLGGRVVGFKGEYPGIAQEAFMMLEKKKPVYLVGGFGGCVADVLHALHGWERPVAVNRDQAKGHQGYVEILKKISTYKGKTPYNGLSEEENRELAGMDDPDQFLPLILRGLIQWAAKPRLPWDM